MSALAEIREQLEAEVDARVEDRVCGCGCGARLEAGGNGRRKYLEGHRQRAYRKRLETEAKAVGVPTRLSLRLVEAANSTDQRHGDAQKPRRKRQSKPRPGLSVYFPTVRDAEMAAVVLRNRADDIPDIDGAVQALSKALDRRHARSAA